MADSSHERVAALLEEMASLPTFYECGSLDVNTAGGCGDTPLIVAIIRGDLQATMDLLDAGANPSAVGEDNFTPLHWAAKRGPAFVRVLLDRGAVCRVRNLFGELPADIARRSADPELVALLGNSPDAEPLSGLADVNQNDNSGAATNGRSCR